MYIESNDSDILECKSSELGTPCYSAMHSSQPKYIGNKCVSQYSYNSKILRVGLHSMNFDEIEYNIYLIIAT